MVHVVMFGYAPRTNILRLSASGTTRDTCPSFMQAVLGKQSESMDTKQVSDRLSADKMESRKVVVWIMMLLISASMVASQLPEDPFYLPDSPAQMPPTFLDSPAQIPPLLPDSPTKLPPLLPDSPAQVPPLLPNSPAKLPPFIPDSSHQFPPPLLDAPAQFDAPVLPGFSSPPVLPIEFPAPFHDPGNPGDPRPELPLSPPQLPPMVGPPQPPQPQPPQPGRPLSRCYGLSSHCTALVIIKETLLSTTCIVPASSERWKSRPGPAMQQFLLDINYYLANVDGVLRPADKKPGGFTKSCYDVKLQGSELSAICARNDSIQVTSKINLIDIVGYNPSADPAKRGLYICKPGPQE